MARSVGVRDVAAQAGVSVASVSRVLNAPATVGLEVRQRVEAAIADLHYIPSAAGRALSTRRTSIVGALIPHLAYSIYAAFIEAMQRQLQLAGYHLLIGLVGYGRETEEAELRQLIMAGAAGVMLAGEQRGPAIYRLLRANRIPYVLNSVYHPDSAHPCIGYDNFGAARQIADHLLDLGHRQIATITGDGARIDRFAERIEGIRHALEARRLALRPEWIVSCNVAIVDARSAFRQLMAGAPVPSAVVCGNDVLALGALLEAQAMGVAVPGDVSITGFDDLEWAAQLSPALTTVHVPLTEMGQRAADYLTSRLRDQPVVHATKIEVSLVLRGSTGPCRRPLRGDR